MSHGGLGTAGGDTQGGSTVRVLACRVEVHIRRRRTEGLGLQGGEAACASIKSPVSDRF